MKPANAALAVFFLAAIVGCLAIALTYIAFADSSQDREGSTGMAVVFMEAPLAGLVIGLIAAIATFKIMTRRG